LDLLRDLLGENSSLLDHATRITQTRLFAGNQEVAFAISPAAASIARWELDEALWRAAERAGAECREHTEVEAVSRNADGFLVETSGGTLETRTVVDASGRWSKVSRRSASEGKSGPQWIGLKAHYSTDEARRVSTDLYFMRGGYCGVQPVAPGRLNVCAMVQATRAVRLAEVFSLHPKLLARSRNWNLATEPVAVAPLIFSLPEPETDGILRVGDAAGFIDPFVGDGISLALRSGKLAAETLVQCWQSGSSLDVARSEYRGAYRRQFVPVFRAAARARSALQASPPIPSMLLQAMRLPGIADLLMRSTR
jgi:flavin-dependent dehydrogenase